MLVNPSNLLLRLLTAMTAFLAPGKGALGMSKPFGRLPGVLGIVDEVSMAISHQRANAHIQPNSILLLKQGVRRCFTDALQIPTRRAQDDACKLQRAFQGPMDNDTETPPHCKGALNRPWSRQLAASRNCMVFQALALLKRGKPILRPSLSPRKKLVKERWRRLSVVSTTTASKSGRASLPCRLSWS